MFASPIVFFMIINVLSFASSFGGNTDLRNSRLIVFCLRYRSATRQRTTRLLIAGRLSHRSSDR